MTAVRWACVVAALGAAACLLVDPHSADLAAQQYRAGLVRDDGFGLWDNGWFAGHHTPAYSLLFPPLGALLGVWVAGAAAALAAAALFAVVAQRHWGARAGSVAAVWFALGITATLVSGRLTFLLGVAIGLCTIVALQSARPLLAAALALLTTLASPVAGLFLALAALAWALAGARGDDSGAAHLTPARAPRSPWPGRRVAGVGIAVAALTPAAALAALFPEGGTEPFVASAFWPALAAVLLVAAALPGRERTLRLGAALYALLCVAAFVIASPLGGNVTRLGALLAGPIFAGALLSSRGAREQAAPRGRGWSGRRDAHQPPASRNDTGAPTPWSHRRAPALLLALVLPLAYWQAYPAVRDVVRASGDPSTAAAYHAPLVRYLESRPGRFGWRVEIPFTANHWEAAHVAPHVALARGWERQLDRRYGALFYDGTLDATSYRAWLDEHAVAYVALPDADLDYAAQAEARLIERGVPYLRAIWHDAHWRVFAVRRPVPLASGGAPAITLDAGGFTLRTRHAGEVLVRVRHSRWWTITSGRACVGRAPGAMTRVRVLAPGTVRVRAQLAGPTCRR